MRSVQPVTQTNELEGMYGGIGLAFSSSQSTNVRTDVRSNDGGGVPFRSSSRVCGFKGYTPVQVIPYKNMVEGIFGRLQDW